MTTYYVDPAGSDSTGTGTASNPWATPWYGAAHLASGDTLMVNDGTWTIATAANTVWISAGGTSETTRTVVRATNPGQAKLINAIAATNSNSNDAAIFVAADFVDVVGFDVSGAAGRVGIDGYGQNGAGSGSPVGSHIRVRQCVVHDLGMSVNSAYNCYGIYVGQYSTESAYMGTYNEVSRCVTRNIGQAHSVGSHGIYMTTGYGVCQNNISSNCAGFGINLFHFPHHMTVANNLVFKCGDTTTTPPQGGGIYLSSATTGTAEMCDFCVVSNNIVRDCTGYAGIYEEQPTGVTVVANNTYSNNDFYGNSGATYGDYHFGSGATSVNQVPLVSSPTSGADTFTRANQTGLGTASDSEPWANTGDTAHLVLSIFSNQGKATGSAADNFLLLGTKIISDFDATVRVSTSASNTSNWQGVLARYLNPTDWYAAIWRGGHFSIRRSLQGALYNDIADTTFAFVANTEYKIHFNLTGSTLSANVWLTSGSEPGGWMLQITDTNLPKGQFGLYCSPDATGTTTVFDSLSYTATQVSEQDPLFVNYQADGTGDYHLSVGSPCIDAGTSTGAPAIDLDGTARPQGSGYDIGPYEWPETSVTTVMTGANTFGEIMSQGSAGTTGAAALPATPSGHGWVYAPGAGSIAAGTWQATITLSASAWGGSSATTQVFLRAFLYSGGFFSPIGAWAPVGITSLAKTAYTFPATAMGTVVTGPQDLVYFDLWWMDTAGIAGNNPTVYVSASATTEITNDLAIGLPVFTPAGGGPGGGPGPLPVASTTYIDGVAYETEAGTMLIDAAVGRRGAASFQMRTAGSVHFEQYQQVAIYDQNAQLAFSGYLTNPQESYPGAPGQLLHTVTCCDQHYLADKRVVAAVYQGQTPGFMAKDLWMRYLAPEGVTIGHLLDTGIAVPETVFAFCTAAEAYDALTSAASSAGVPYYWQIDFQQALWFVPYTALVNVNAIDGTQIDDGRASGVVPTLTRANPLYRNTQYIAGAVAQTGIQSETRHGDGTSRTFSLGYALGNAAPAITKNGTAQTVGLKGTSGSQWYWAQGDDVITQDSGETLLIATDTLVVVYTGQYPTVVLDKNSGQIAYQGALDGSTGIVETVEQDNTITSVASGMQRAGQLLTRYATQGTSLVVATLTAGYAPGQLVAVDLPMFGLSGAQMLIESVSASDQQDGVNLWYTLTLILGPYDTSWTTFFSTLLASVQPPNSLNVGLSTAVGLVEEFLASLGLSGTGTGTLSAAPLPSPLLYPSAVLYPG